MPDQSLSNPVRHRRVFYIPGYDPMHPRRYRELYRTEGAKQAEISGYSIGISPKSGGETYGWKAAGKIEGHSTITEVDVLVWSDIVRDSMSNSIPATYLQLLRTAWVYLSTGTLRRLMWMRKGPVIAALYPVGMLLAQLLAAFLLAWIPSRLLEWGGEALSRWATPTFIGWGMLENTATLIGVLIATICYIVSWVLFIGIIIYALRWFKAKDNKLFAYYLMHDYAFSARYKGANPKPLEERMEVFADQIAAALTADVEEVLVVGHSSGAHLAISILADLLRNNRIPKTGPELNFLSLGQVVPMVSFLPEAYALRKDLATLAVQDRITWIDVTAPGDGCSFALCDPVAVTGVAPPGQKWPVIISAAFSQTLSPEMWAELRWKFFRLHFQYLCAFDQPGDYDYFKITAGPKTLSERYRGRASSKNRIDVQASKYTSLSP